MAESIDKSDQFMCRRCGDIYAAAVCTSMRFVPSVKAKYEYGVIIFMLTYSLILVSGYRIADDWRLAWERVLLCSLGVVVCVGTSMTIFPAWAGTDLHNAVIANFDDVAFMLKGNTLNPKNPCFHRQLLGVKNCDIHPHTTLIAH